ncbi:MAG: DUF2189 domain-containing protein [Halioglobus sp.]|nr:DUF2189 domain-containing protein [Halioglobus sp.]
MATANHPVDTYPVHNVPLSRPFIWLAEGWEDLRHHRGASLAYGLLVYALGALILAYGRHPFFIAAVAVGFLLVGPVLTAGLCELSRCRDEGEVANFQSSLLSLNRARGSLLAVAETLALLAVIWFALSGALYLGLVGDLAPGLELTLWGDVARHLSTSQMIAYTGIGLVLAAIVFVLSVVTIPMIVERHVEASTAMHMSLRVTFQDFPAMLVWAALIAGLVVIGFLTGLLGMVVIFPLLGHATWRAYKELVD